jgi:hypothetical protein
MTETSSKRSDGWAALKVSGTPAAGIFRNHIKLNAPAADAIGLKPMDSVEVIVDTYRSRIIIRPATGRQSAGLVRNMWRYANVPDCLFVSCRPATKQVKGVPYGPIEVEYDRDENSLAILVDFVD